MRKLLLSLTIAFLLLGDTFAEGGPKVVVSIKPVHSLVAGVMQGVGEPTLLLKGGASPHDYSLRPSDVRAINQAKVVFWIGKNLETFLVKPLENAQVLQAALMEAPGIELLPLREGGIWEPHEGHQHAEVNRHAQDHGKAKDDEHESHDDPHIWLNPRNAMAMVRQMGTVLSEVDPGHKTIYQTNVDTVLKRLETLDEELKTKLTPVKGKPYIVFHDAYQYLERHYGLTAMGSITLNPEQRPGTRRLQEIRKHITDHQVICVFSEPQFKPALVNNLVENTTAKSGILDPEGGADLTEGPDAYFQLLTNLASSLSRCLGAEVP